MRRIVVTGLPLIVAIATAGSIVSAHFGARGAQAATAATFTVNAPAVAQPISMPFDVTVDLSGVTFDAASPYWAGYQLELSYDSTVLSAAVLGPTLCQQPAVLWRDMSSPGDVDTGCFSQASTATSGVLETIAFTCNRDGTSPLHLVPRGDKTALVAGTGLFDQTNTDFNMTLVDATVTCQASGPTATATNTATITSTPTITNTPTSSPTATATPPPPPDAPVGAVTTYQLNALHDGHGVGTLSPALSLAWSTDLGATVGYPLVVNGRVFVAASSCCFGYGAQLYALDEASGAIDWGPVNLGGLYYINGIAADGSNVYSITFGGLLQAFDQVTGQMVWQRQLPYQYAFTSPPTVAGGTLFVGGAGSGGTVYAVRAADGSSLWTASVANGDHSSPAVTDDAVYVSYACEVTYRLDRGTGRNVWTHTTGCSGGGGRTPVFHNGNLYVRDAAGMGPVVLSSANGSPVGSFLSSTAPAFDGQLAFYLYNGALSAVDLTSGVVRWTTRGDGTFSAAPLVVDGKVVAASSSGLVSLYDENTGALVGAAIAGGVISPPDEGNAGMLVGLAAADATLFVPVSTKLVAYRAGPPSDADRDGCSDFGETLRGLNPLNPWDFYSVPIPALFAAANPLGEARDSAVGPADAQAIFAYFKRSAKAGSPEYEQDLNGNGIKDGIEYDRSFVSAGKSGPPDGVISATDAQLAFAQFKMNYHC